jgi:hypothetical protein
MLTIRKAISYREAVSKGIALIFAARDRLVTRAHTCGMTISIACSCWLMLDKRDKKFWQRRFIQWWIFFTIYLHK